MKDCKDRSGPPPLSAHQCLCLSRLFLEQDPARRHTSRSTPGTTGQFRTKSIRSALALRHIPVAIHAKDNLSCYVILLTCQQRCILNTHREQAVVGSLHRSFSVLLLLPLARRLQRRADPGTLTDSCLRVHALGGKAPPLAAVIEAMILPTNQSLGCLAGLTNSLKCLPHVSQMSENLSFFASTLCNRMLIPVKGKI